MLSCTHDRAGMAGSGKTTLMQRMAAHLNDSGKPAYVLNLDPAVMNVPYGANIDIRDTVCLSSAMATITCTTLWRVEPDCVLAS